MLASASLARADETAAARARERAAATALDESSSKVAAAGQALLKVRAALPAAERQAADARGRLLAAQVQSRRRAAEAQQAAQRRDDAQQALDAAAGQVRQGRRDVAAMARQAYRGGQLAELRTLMSASRPEDLLERSGLLRAVTRHRDARLDAVTAARLRFASRTADADRQSAEAQEAAERARAASARADTVAGRAAAAAAQVRSLLAARSTALRTAESLRSQDAQEYAAAQQASRDLAARIRAAAAEARRRAEAQRREAERRAAEQTERAAAAPPRRRAAAPPPETGTGWQWPADGPMTSDYGYRTHPIYGGRRFHAGIDVGAPAGATIVAARGGTVLASYYSSSYGNLTVIDHGTVAGERLTTSYAHQTRSLVSEGQVVRGGQAIGEVGSTGNSTGPHLHFEVRRDGEPVDPTRYVGRR